MRITVTQIGEGVRNYPVLKNWVRFFDDDPDSLEFNAHTLFEGDPDLMRKQSSALTF